MSDLRQAAQAVLNRWDSPNWEWKHYGSPRFLPTATLMSALRKALAEQQAEPVHGDIRALKYRIHELEGEVMGYKRMLDVAEAASQPQQQAEPVAWNGKSLASLLREAAQNIQAKHGAFNWEFVALEMHRWLKATHTTPPQSKPLTDEQADQIISGLQTCHHQSSKREFLKVWLRDWAAHHIQEPKS